jgi:putative nucleotidyltransferase with HDIG domain
MPPAYVSYVTFPASGHLELAERQRSFSFRPEPGSAACPLPATTGREWDWEPKRKPRGTAVLTNIAHFTLQFRSFFSIGNNLLPVGRLGQYILLVGLLGTGLLIWAVSQIPVDQPFILATLFVMILAAEWAPIKLVGTPLQGTALSVSAAIAFAALLVLGPAGSILVNTGCALAYCLKEKRPFYKRWFTSATLMFCSGFAGLAYTFTGGKLPMSFEGRDLAAAGAAAVAYLLANSCLVSGAISLQTGRPFRSVLENWQWLFLELLTTLAVGMTMALAYDTPLRLTGFLLSTVLLALPWYSIYFYVKKSREAAEQTERLNQAKTHLEQANKALDLQIGSLRALHDIGISLNSAQSLDEILHQILASVVDLTHADSTALFLDQESGRLTIAGQIGLSDQYLAAPELSLNGAAARALRENRLLVIDRTNYQSAMFSASAEREGIRAAACLPLVVAGETVGVLDVCSKSDHVFDEDEVRVLRTLGEQAAVAIHNARLVGQIHEGYLSTISALAATVEAKDTYTRGHSEMVRRLAVAVGRQMNLPARQIELLNLGALFHDIGKIGVSEFILNKGTELTEEEWKEMREHPLIGERILRKVPTLAEVHPIVRHHHERPDGTGYPDGICAEQDLLASIIAVCDAYQAMTSERPYRRAMSHTAALEELESNSGTQFVTRVVQAFGAAVEYQDPRQMIGYRFNPALLLHRPVA